MQNYIILLFILFIGCASTITEANKHDINWEEIYKKDITLTSKEWANPSRITQINTSGWEDGAYIAPDDRTLYFTYINVDLIKLPQQIVIGPTRDKRNICSPPCGNFPRPDVFYSTKDAPGNWQTPVPHPLTIKYPIGGIVFSDHDNAYFHQEKNDGNKTDLYFAENRNGTWQKPERLKTLNSKYSDDDPHILPTNDEIFYWSNRPEKLKGSNIFYSKKINGNWVKPVMLPEPINSNRNDMQPFVHGKHLYFSSDRDGKQKIYRSTFTDGMWSEPVVVVESSFAVGEPTLTDDGNYLYFIQIFKSDINTFNPEIMRIERIN